MSNAAVTQEDYDFFDFLAPYVWPTKSKEHIAELREDVGRGLYQIETLCEVALAEASKGLYYRDPQKGRDLTGYDGKDWGDVKKVVSQARNNNKKKKQWTNSFKVSGIKNKTGVLRIIGKSKEANEFYFFAIHPEAYVGKDELHITLDRSTGYQMRKGKPRNKWARYQVKSFDELATISEDEALVLHHGGDVLRQCHKICVLEGSAVNITV